MARTVFPYSRTVLAAIALAGCVALAPTVAQAQPLTGEQRVRALIDQSLDHYDTLMLEDAVRVLLEALQVAESEAVDGAIVAEAHLMLGIVDHALYADSDRTIDHFVRGLTEDRSAELNPYYTNPELDGLLAASRERVPDEPDIPPEPVTVLQHMPIVTARSGQPVTVLASIPDGTGVRRVVLGYRGFGQERYQLTTMQLSSPVDFFATISGTDTEEAGLQLEYFLQALGEDDRILDSSGSPNSPHVVVMLDADPSTGQEAIGDAVSFAIGAGTGGGLATGEPLVMGGRVDLNPGVAVTPLHLYADLGIYFADVFQFVPFLRLQLVLLENGVEVEPLVGAKLRWYFLAEAKTRMYASFGGGWGHVRHTVDLNPTVNFVDTTKEGPFHGGVGFGYVYMFAENVGVLVDIYTMVLFDEVSVQLDLNAGLLFSF